MQYVHIIYCILIRSCDFEFYFNTAQSFSSIVLFLRSDLNQVMI